MSGTAHMSANRLLTIEETADELGISVATARRWASSGKIAASKAGKQWLVDGTKLRPTQPRRHRAASPTVDLRLALRHVVRTDLAQVWVPDVLNYEDWLADPERLLQQASGVLANCDPGPAIEVQVDKSLVFTRQGVLLSLPDRIAYQAIVGTFAQRIEAEMPPSVYSARLSETGDTFLRQGADQWVRWRESVLERLTETTPWLVETDLTAHFDTVNTEALMAEIRSLNVDGVVVETLRGLLRVWQPVQGVGLPQGPNASRLLANLHLIPVDRAMLREGFVYSRFMDDVRIVSGSRPEAVRAVRFFQSECRVRGLIVNASKTRLLEGETAKDTLRQSDDLNFIQYLMDRGSIRLSRRRLQQVLRKALSRPLQIDDRRVRFSLWRLSRLKESGTLTLVLKHLEDLGPHAQIVAGYLRPFVSRPRVVRAIDQFLSDPQRSQSRYVTAWLLAAMMEHPGVLPRVWADNARTIAFNRNEPAYLRALASVVTARGGERDDVERIKAELARERDPTMLRGYAVALHWAGALDDEAARLLTRRSPDLDTTLRYLASHPAMPSLIHHDRDVSLL